MNIEIWDLIWIAIWGVSMGISLSAKKSTSSEQKIHVIATIASSVLSFFIVYKAGMFL